MAAADDADTPGGDGIFTWSDDGRVQVWLDVANLLGSRPDGWWRDRAGATTRLLQSVQRCAVDAAGWQAQLASSVSPDGLVAVLEGAARRAEEPPPVTAGGLPLRVMRAAGSGDDAIAEACRAGDLVVTADRGLRARCEARGATVVGPRTVLGLIDSDEPAPRG